ILDDHVPFQELGIPAIDLIDFNYGPSNLYWHSAEDKLENISAENIGIVANVTLGMLIKIQNEGNSILGEKSK
ncbi:MAG: M28 family peptidase, partial [Candidatus Nanoarchaeia archaeon]